MLLPLSNENFCVSRARVTKKTLNVCFLNLFVQDMYEIGGFYLHQYDSLNFTWIS